MWFNTKDVSAQKISAKSKDVISLSAIESSFFSRIDIQNHIVALDVNKKVCFVMFHLSNAPS